MNNPRPDFAHRSHESEWLDGSDIEAGELEPFLRDLARFNRAMLGHRPILAWLRRLTADVPPGVPLTLVDAGCGYGDLLRAIRRWSRNRRLTLRLVGLDVRDATVAIARDATKASDDIEYRHADIFAYRPPEAVDFVVSNLLAHHLCDAEIIGLLRAMEATARRGWLICDLERHAVPYFFIGLMGRLTSLDRMMIRDGQISVTRSLTRAEWEQRIASAGITSNAVDLRSYLYRFVIARARKSPEFRNRTAVTPPLPMKP
jgi:SAM-dependent methyltransferase